MLRITRNFDTCVHKDKACTSLQEECAFNQNVYQILEKYTT